MNHQTAVKLFIAESRAVPTVNYTMSVTNKNIYTKNLNIKSYGAEFIMPQNLIQPYNK